MKQNLEACTVAGRIVCPLREVVFDPQNESLADLVGRIVKPEKGMILFAGGDFIFATAVPCAEPDFFTICAFNGDVARIRVFRYNEDGNDFVLIDSRLAGS